MQHPLTPGNPFGYTPKGLAFEIVLESGVRGAHLDYGAHSGDFVAALGAAGLVTSGVGVDVNVQVVERFRPSMPPNVRLESIVKHAPLDFPRASFDSVSIIGVLEHVHDQTRLLRQLVALLKPGGLLVIAVPGAHLFSWADMGNFKFRFPRLHRLIYTALHSPEEYRARYVECRHGLFGDIEVEKMWHEHFSESSMRRLLEPLGVRVEQVDGQGFFQRPMANLAYFVGGRSGPLRPLIDIDARLFDHCELVFSARVG